MTVTSKAVIIAHGRTGSTLLVNLLNRQPGVRFLGEIFNEQAIFLPEAMRPEGQTPETLKVRRSEDPVGFLDEVVTLCREPIFGFKLLRGHSPAARAHVIADPDWRCIILYRDNYLAVHASLLTARATGVWVRYGPKDKPKPAAAAEADPLPPLAFDAGEFLRGFTQYRRYYLQSLRECDAAGKPFQLVEYHQLQRPEIVRNLARHIGVEAPVFPRVAVAKQGSPSLLERFSNPQDVMAALREVGRPDWAEDRESYFVRPEKHQEKTLRPAA